MISGGLRAALLLAASPAEAAFCTDPVHSGLSVPIWYTHRM